MTDKGLQPLVQGVVLGRGMDWAQHFDEYSPLPYKKGESGGSWVPAARCGECLEPRSVFLGARGSRLSIQSETIGLRSTGLSLLSVGP